MVTGWPKRTLRDRGSIRFCPCRTSRKGRRINSLAVWFHYSQDICLLNWIPRKTHGARSIARWVSRVLFSLGGTPTPVPNEIVNEFISRCDGEGILRPTQASTAHTRPQKPQNPQKSTSIQPQCQSAMPQSKSLNSCWGNRSDFLRFLKGLGNPRKQRQCGAVFR